MLTRRAFHSQLLIAAFASTLPLARRAAATANPGAAADQVLNRLSFGATPESRVEFAALGPQRWFEAQLAMPESDPVLDAMLATARLRIAYDAGDDGEGRSWPAVDELRPLSALNADPADRVRLLDFTQGMEYSERERPAREVIAASLIRAVHAQAQLREVMAQFWHEHFSVTSTKVEMTAVFFPDHDRIMRRHAFGNFRELLGEVARSPAMLYYLNNEDSQASPANENFARELFELHTLGVANYINDTAPNWRSVPGAAEGLALAYIDQDVYEVARAFTGWTVGDGRWISDGVEAPRTGRFHYVEAWHDPYQKRVLGTEFPPNRAPMADGDQVLDILATHPGTAQFVCRKLIRRLLADDPDPAMTDRVARVFLTHSGSADQIAQVIRAIVADPAFAATPPQKLRRPFEFLAALYRATGARVVSPEAAFSWALGEAGWWQHEYGPPTGHPDRTDRWTSATTLNRTVDLALYAHDDWFGCTDTRLSRRLPAEALSFGAISAHWLERLFGPGAADAMAPLTEALGVESAGEPMTLSDEERHEVSAAVIAFAALTPQFLLR